MKDQLLQARIEKRIAGGLRSCINDHGPITKEFIGSAAKRIRISLENNGFLDWVATVDGEPLADMVAESRTPTGGNTQVSGSGTADTPTRVRFENGQVYDEANGQQIDLNSQTGQVIREAAEQYGNKHHQSWDQLNGTFQFDADKRQLMDTTSSS